ncbi:hypothetical protein D5272_17480 [bacterium D16-76]|nr:hypothetical protein [bacterium D16-76]
MLNDFHHNHVDEFESYVEYVDNGHTGTDTERESLQRLLRDVMSEKTNCVVVQDLSRFAQNYSDSGRLIDNLFVQMGVRFISLAEGVDMDFGGESSPAASDGLSATCFKAASRLGARSPWCCPCTRFPPWSV